MNPDDWSPNMWLTVILIFWLAFLGLSAYLEYKQEKDGDGDD